MKLRKTIKITKKTKILSDTHFGHNRITEFEPNRLKRASFENQDQMLLDTWNKQISNDDNILHLGDFAFKSVQNYTSRVNGNISLILGNHDRKGSYIGYKDFNVFKGLYVNINGYELHKEYEDELFSCYIADIMGEKILFSHYPVFNQNPYDSKNSKISCRTHLLENIYINLECTLNIFGHLHSTPCTFKNGINVCLDSTDFKILTIEEHIKKFRKGNK